MSSTAMTPISLRLRELRTAKGWTQQELAERSGVPQYTISRLESGEPESVNLAHLEQLADALEVDAGYLILHSKKGKGKRG
jgi:transcriptional regulator with XRE-family HTH domain